MISDEMENRIRGDVDKVSVISIIWYLIFYFSVSLLPEFSISQSYIYSIDRIYGDYIDQWRSYSYGIVNNIDKIIPVTHVYSIMINLYIIVKMSNVAKKLYPYGKRVELIKFLGAVILLSISVALYYFCFIKLDANYMKFKYSTITAIQMVTIAAPMLTYNSLYVIVITISYIVTPSASTRKRGR
ncbi:MAG: hypothetical protein HQL56_07120 [Magnetococcales bacterium]|nr:hypothetical protein [Magnetococcales bacterium]